MSDIFKVQIGVESFLGCSIFAKLPTPLLSQITFRSNVLYRHFYLPEVDIQVQNGQGVLGSLVPSILDMGLAWLDSMAILDLYMYFR